MLRRSILDQDKGDSIWDAEIPRLTGKCPKKIFGVSKSSASSITGKFVVFSRAFWTRSFVTP